MGGCKKTAPDLGEGGTPGRFEVCLPVCWETSAQALTGYAQLGHILRFFFSASSLSRNQTKPSCKKQLAGSSTTPVADAAFGPLSESLVGLIPTPLTNCSSHANVICGGGAVC